MKNVERIEDKLYEILKAEVPEEKELLKRGMILTLNWVLTDDGIDLMDFFEN